MTLRVEDLKPGDEILFPITVDRVGIGVVYVEAMTLRDADLAAGNAERVVRPRPVRKGDEVVFADTIVPGGPFKFIAVLDRDVCIYEAGTDTVDLYEKNEGITHADGSPISWEESE